MICDLWCIYVPFFGDLRAFFGGLRTRTLVVYGLQCLVFLPLHFDEQTPDHCSRWIGKLHHFVEVLAMRIVACAATCGFHTDITVINGGNDFNFIYFWEQLRSPAPPAFFDTIWLAR